MKKLFFLLAVLCVGLNAEACRFTIREIAYSRLLLEQYQLVFHADSNTNQDLIDDFNSLSFAYLLESNIESAVHKQEGISPKISFLSKGGTVLHQSQIENSEDIVQMINSCTSSPVRNLLLNQLGKSFAVILYFEGKSNSSQEYERIIAKAMEQFNKVSEHLDKAVSEELVLIKVSNSDRISEELLLAALEVPADNQQAVVSVLYGRGRLAGKALIGKEISTEKIFNMLVLIGTDCECGVDLSPLLEKSVPLNWSGKQQTETANMLNFDVDNPMILTEMSKILSKGMSIDQKNLESNIPQFFELKKDGELDKNGENIKTKNKAISWTIYTLLILFVLVLAVALIIYIRKK